MGYVSEIYANIKKNEHFADHDPKYVEWSSVIKKLVKDKSIEPVELVQKHTIKNEYGRILINHSDFFTKMATRTNELNSTFCANNETISDD